MCSWCVCGLQVLPAGSVHWVICVCPGAFDQHGCPLIVFPVDGQAKLSSEVGKAEVVDFINYFLCLHKYAGSLFTLSKRCASLRVRDVPTVGLLCLRSKKQEKDSSVSVVADLRQASLQTTRFIAETLLLLEVYLPFPIVFSTTCSYVDFLWNGVKRLKIIFQNGCKKKIVW